MPNAGDAAALHVRAQKAAARTMGRAEALLAGTNLILAVRERELLDLKGPCSHQDCRLHDNHLGPCDTREERPE